MSTSRQSAFMEGHEVQEKTRMPWSPRYVVLTAERSKDTGVQSGQEAQAAPQYMRALVSLAT